MVSKILVVDDDFAIRRLYELILEEAGLTRVKFASNGVEAVKIYKSLSEKPEIIIMDYRMPLMNGIEAMNEIKELHNGAKVIFVSADETIQEKALSEGAVEFLKKPVDIYKFQKSIINVINRFSSNLQL